jgi:hypothetical protein
MRQRKTLGVRGEAQDGGMGRCEAEDEIRKTFYVSPFTNDRVVQIDSSPSCRLG